MTLAELLAGMHSRGNAGHEVWIKGRSWIETGHWRKATRPHKVGSAARRGPLVFPLFARSEA